MPVSLRYAARSDVGLGSKSRNEDSAYAGPELLLLCDGMGGHAAGDVASSLVVGELAHLDGESHGADDALDILERALEEANSRLADVMDAYPDSEGMGTTCIAMLRAGTKLAVANIGDSRAYLLRGGRLTQITKDHSFVQQLLDEGRIGAEEALHHPQRSLVTRVFTGRADDQPDLSMRELRVGDRILICSDGLTDYAAEDTVGEILAQADRTPGQIADQLIQLALRASTRDNVTVIVADAVSSGQGTTKAQVVGAASERRNHRNRTSLTPAQKAAELSREASGVPADTGPVLAEEGPTSPLVRILRRVLVTAAVLAVLGAGGWLAWGWSQTQYYVGEQDGQVAIFRGLAQEVGPLSLSEVEQETDLALDALPSYYQERVRRTLSASDRAGADTIVAELRSLADGGRGTPAAPGDDDVATVTLSPTTHPLTRLLELGDQLGGEPTSDPSPTTAPTTSPTSAPAPTTAPTTGGDR